MTTSTTDQKTQIRDWLKLDPDGLAQLSPEQQLDEIEVAYRIARLSVGEQLENALIMWRMNELSDNQFQSEMERLDSIHDVFEEALNYYNVSND